MKHIVISKALFVTVTWIIAIAMILVAGCTDAASTSQGPQVAINKTQNTASADITPVTTRETGTVSQTQTTPSCANPPLNPWTGVPESYSSSLTKSTGSSLTPGTLVSKADLFGTPSLKWEEYKTTPEIKGLPRYEETTRHEYSNEVYDGKPVMHDNFTYVIYPSGTSPEDGQINIDDIYYDDLRNVVYYHRTVIQNNEILENRELQINGLENRASPDCSGEMWAPEYTYLGTETVTVPAGTFPNAGKYVEKITDDPMYGKNATSTHWFAPGVPVEVKRVLEGSDKGIRFTDELTGWG